MRTISQTATEAGIGPDTLRYYEKVGLVDPDGRTEAGYRLYNPAAVQRIWFIKGAQRMGLRLHDIKELLDVRDRGACPCGHTRTLLQQRLEETDQQLHRLQQLRQQLIDMLTGLDDCPPAPTGTWWCETEFTTKGGDQR